MQTARSQLQQGAHSQAQSSVWLVKMPQFYSGMERETDFIQYGRYREGERGWGCVPMTTGEDSPFSVQYSSSPESLILPVCWFPCKCGVQLDFSSCFWVWLRFWELWPSCWRPPSPAWSNGWSCPAAPVAGLSSPSSTLPPVLAAGRMTLPPCWRMHVWPADQWNKCIWEWLFLLLVSDLASQPCLVHVPN